MRTYGRDCCAACEAAGDPHRDECRPHPVHHPTLLRRLLAQNTTACQEPSVENPGSGEGASPLRLCFRNANQFGFGDGGNPADVLDHRRSHLAVKPHQGDSLDAAFAREPPQRKRGDVPCSTVPSMDTERAHGTWGSHNAATSMVCGKPYSRRRVCSSTARPRAAATVPAFTRFTFSSRTVLSRPANTALRKICVPSSAGSPA